MERRFELSVTGLELPIIGFVDLVADLDGRKTLIDFKTAASRYGAHEVELSDQLAAYCLAEPDAEQTALCILVGGEVAAAMERRAIAQKRLRRVPQKPPAIDRMDAVRQ